MNYQVLPMKKANLLDLEKNSSHIFATNRKNRVLQHCVVSQWDINHFQSHKNNRKKNLIKEFIEKEVQYWLSATRDGT